MSFSSCYPTSWVIYPRRLPAQFTLPPPGCIYPHHRRRRRSRIGHRPLWCHEEVWRPSSLKARSANDSRPGLQWHFAVLLVPAASRGPPPQAEENQVVGLERSRFRKPNPASKAPDNNRRGDVFGRVSDSHGTARPGPARFLSRPCYSGTLARNGLVNIGPCLQSPD